MAATYTHKELSRLLKVSETTIKSYRRKFPDCIPVANQGKPIRFTDSAYKVCRRIRDHFNSGMSVDEVRARLAQEFSWIAPETPREEEAVPTVALPQDFTVAVSNLAKSMVTLTQQQGGILRRMQEIEKVLERANLPQAGEGASLAVSGGGMVSGGTAGSGTDEAVLQQTMARLERLDTMTETLQSAVVGLSAAITSMQQPAAASAGSSQESKVYRFPRPEAEPAMPEAVPASDPPRHMLSMPLVVRTAQGTYIGAGGRSRGRFTLNDLKALLAFGKANGEQYHMRWDMGGDGAWWLVLDGRQDDAERQLRLRLQELPTQRGIAVAEVAQLTDNGNSVHPAEICAFIASLSGEF